MSEEAKGRIREQYELQNCRKKRRYMTIGIAEMKAELWNARARKDDRSFPYKCRVCGFFHLSTVERGRR